MAVVLTNRKSFTPCTFKIAELIEKEGFKPGISILGENQDPFTLHEKGYIEIYDPDPTKKKLIETRDYRYSVPSWHNESPHIATFHLKTCNKKEWGMYCLDPEYYEKIKQLAEKIDAQFSKEYGISKINLIYKSLPSSSVTIVSE